jgi:hypothetical protein
MLSFKKHRQQKLNFRRKSVTELERIYKFSWPRYVYDLIWAEIRRRGAAGYWEA